MKKLLFIIPVILLFLNSCTERIDIQLDEGYTRLVVYGTITTDTTRHIVELSKTTSYYYNEAPPMVSGASVDISDDLGKVEDLTEIAPGKYATSPTFAAIPGRIYTLQIDLPEAINGHKSYTATSAVSEIHSIDSIGLNYQPDWGEKGYYEVTCFYQDPGATKDYYMFNIFKNGILLTDTISKRFIVDDVFFNGSYTNGIGVGYLDQAKEREVLHTGDTITFQGCNISADYYNFIYTLQTETGFQTPLFSGPPANVKGNINNGAAGYFAAYGVAYSSLIFKP
jgi:hypothetical protein